MGTWEHLAGAVPMVLSNNIAGMTFSGADVGGFFGNPSEEMLVRWYQSGAFHPFFRAHAHIDTKRREPYLFDEPIRSYLRDAIRLRYSLLPAWYTGFFHASLSGSPIAKPHYVVFPDDAAGFAEDKQFFVSNSGLLVKPVVEEGATTASVYLADDQPYYNYFDRSIYTRASSSSSRSHITVPAELSQLPLFHHGGSILTRRDTVRRAAPLMWKDPITLVIALDKAGTRASGDIYLDDGDSYNFEKGELVWRGFELSSGEGKTLKLESIDLVKAYRGANEQFAKMAASYDLQNAYAKSIATVTVGEIQILGLSKAPTCVSVPGSASGLDYEFVEGAASNAGSKKNGQAASLLKIFNAELPITKDWTLSIDFDIGKACQTRPAARDSASVEDPTCPKAGMKRCQNKGHISACVLLSRVNDGICDPECCDGSDETDGKVNCPDRCAAVNKEFRAKADEESRIQRVGAKIRKDWSTAGLKEKRKIERSIEKIRTEIVGLQDKEASLKAVLDKVERSEAGEIEKKKNSKLFKRMEEYQSTVTSLRKHREYLHDQVSSLQNLLEDLKKSFNPNYQDMAVLGAVRAFDDWRRKNGYAVTEDMPEESEGAEDSQPKPKEDVVPVEVDFDDLSEDQLKSFESEDILGLMAELDAGPGQETANLREWSDCERTFRHS
jgi:alpha 1,3-glucosidase